MIPYGKQSIDEDDIAEVVRVLKSDYLTTGPEVPAFELALCEVLGARHAVACANGTAALHLIALSLELQPGDQVVVPSISFVATANGPRYCGAEIVFADVDPVSGLATVQTIREAIERCDPARLRALFVVHMGGHAVDMPGMRALADKHGVALVEDACHAIGSKYLGSDGDLVRVGSGAHADFSALSLHPVKTITCGEGGVVLTPHDDHAAKLQLLRSHGLVRNPDDWLNTSAAFDERGKPNDWYYEQQTLGFNYRLTDFQAALARSQLAKLPAFAARRKELVRAYRTRLDGASDFIRLVPEQPGADPVLHLMVMLVDFTAVGKTRLEIMQELRKKGVGTQVHYIPIHLQPYYQNASADTLVLPGALTHYSQCLSLPLFPGMENQDVNHVVDTILAVVG